MHGHGWHMVVRTCASRGRAGWSLARDGAEGGVRGLREGSKFASRLCVCMCVLATGVVVVFGSEVDVYENVD